MEKNINSKLKPQKENIESYFDKEKMTKIMTNLLSNAFKFTPEGGEIIVSIKEIQSNNVISKESSTEKSSRYGNKISPPTIRGRNDNMGSVEIRIKDTGIGIPADRLPKIFDRFYQVDGSQTREHEGTGIGLALAKELIELHEGKIAVNSKEGEGSEFISANYREESLIREKNN